MPIDKFPTIIKLNIDFSDYSNAINKNGVIHIWERHGEGGQQDSTMREIADIARINYVIQNADYCEYLTNSKGQQRYSQEHRDKSSKLSPLIRFVKKINGNYYAVVAASENSNKKIWAVTAYMTKNKTALRKSFDETEVPPKSRPETSVTSRLSYSSSITENSESDKPKQKWSIKAATPEEKQTLKDLGFSDKEIETDPIPTVREEGKAGAEKLVKVASQIIEGLIGDTRSIADRLPIDKFPTIIKHYSFQLY